MNQGVRTAEILIAMAIGISGCTGSSATPEPTESGSTIATSPTTTDSPSPSTPTDPSRREPAEVWAAFHEERLAQLATTAEPDGDAFADLATDAGAAVAESLIATGRADTPETISDHEVWPVVDNSDDGRSAEVADCILVASDRGGDTSVHSQGWTGAVVRTDHGWRVDAASPGVGDCVPAGLARDAVQAYESWLDGIAAWWDPPDPEHPRLEQITVGDGLDDMREILREHQVDGVAVRGMHDPVNAVVFELGIGEVTVSDCYEAEAGADLAAYDVETGERLEELSPEPAPGQTDRMTVDLVRHDGEWLVEGWLSRTAADCTPGGSPYVVMP